MSSGFELVSADLTKAAGQISAAVAPVACWTLSSAGASAEAYGHDELAEVVAKFCARASEVVSQTASGDEQAAGQLRSAARRYDSTDSTVDVMFADLVGGTSQ